MVITTGSVSCTSATWRPCLRLLLLIMYKCHKRPFLRLFRKPSRSCWQPECQPGQLCQGQLDLVHVHASPAGQRDGVRPEVGDMRQQMCNATLPGSLPNAHVWLEGCLPGCGPRQICHVSGAPLCQPGPAVPKRSDTARPRPIVSLIAFKACGLRIWHMSVPTRLQMQPDPIILVDAALVRATQWLCFDREPSWC